MSSHFHVLLRKQNYPGRRCTNWALFSFQAFNVEGFCGPILEAHLEEDPRSFFKFCTYIIIYQNSFSTECIYAHIDIFIYMLNAHANNMKYRFFFFIPYKYKYIEIETSLKISVSFRPKLPQLLPTSLSWHRLGIDFLRETCFSTCDGCCLNCPREVHIPGKMFKVGFKSSTCGDHRYYLWEHLMRKSEGSTKSNSLENKLSIWKLLDWFMFLQPERRNNPLTKRLLALKM